MHQSESETGYLWLVGLPRIEGAGGVDALLGRDLAHLVQILLPLHELVRHLLQSILTLHMHSSALKGSWEMQVQGCT